MSCINVEPNAIKMILLIKIIYFAALKEVAVNGRNIFQAFYQLEMSNVLLIVASG